MANYSSTKEQALYSLIFQVFLIISCVLIIILLILPRWEKIQNQKEATHIAIEQYNTTLENGMPFGKLIQKLTAMGDRSEIIEVIHKNTDTTKEAIKKEGDLPYLDWLKKVSMSNNENKHKIEIAEKKINSIIPRLGNSNSSIENENFSLKEYIKYFEKNILQNTGFEDFSPLGITNIQYKEDGLAHASIGSFDATFSFIGTNKKIKEFFGFLQTAGEPSILEQADSLLSESGSKIFSNPLITIESAYLEIIPTALSDDLVNTGKVSLRFYIRGASEGDQLLLKETFKRQIAQLEEKIQTKFKECEDATSSCYAQITEITKIQKKLQDFKRGVGDMNLSQSTSIENILLLNQQIQSVKVLKEQLDSLITS